MNPSYAQEARRAQQRGRLSDDLVARATGAAPSTVRGWLAGTSNPTGRRADRVTELSAVVERLSLVIDDDSISVWLNKPIAALDDEKPVDVIGRGDYRRVTKPIAALGNPPAA